MKKEMILPFVILLLLLAACTQPRAVDHKLSSEASATVLPVEENTPSSAAPQQKSKESTAAPVPEDERPPASALNEFSTDFSIHTVPYSKIRSGGPGKDGIPAIDSPFYVSISEADEWIEDVEPVIFLELGGTARAYPLQILTWHEIVNDVLNDTPVLITFCPLCNTAIGFNRSIGGKVYDFGTTGRLRYSNLIMYDRQTESWWQQATGEAIVGELTGTELEMLPATIISWEQFKQEYPNGDVLSRETGHIRNYGINPYTGYDDINNPPFLYDGPETPGRLPPVARVLAAEVNGVAVAYPYDVLSETLMIQDEPGGEPVVAFWTKGTASALDTLEISEGRDVGSALLFSRKLDNQVLTFEVENGRVFDLETGSEWSFLGTALNGPLSGSQLEQVISNNHFWFSWAAFRPKTRIYQPGE